MHVAQVFRIWIFPFYAAPVSLVTVLKLAQDKQTQRYFIKSQNDLYQTNEWVRFVWFGGFVFVWLFQVVAAAMCVLGAVVLSPISWLEERMQHGRTGKELK